ETPERAELRFIVDRGQPVVVRDVSFPGATRLSAGTLRDVLNELLENELPFGEHRTQPQPSEGDLAGGGAFLWVRPAQIYVPELYAEAARRMANRFREAGFLDPGVPPPRVERVRLPDGRLVLDIAFAVTEGPRTILDEVTFEGNETVASRTLVDQIRLRLGVPLSSVAREEARTALAEYYRERGYSFVRVEPHVDASPDHTRARIRFEIHEGPEVRVGRVVLRGNIRTADWVVLQRLELHTGELYRPTRVRATQRRLGETGFFSGVTITPIDPDVEAPVKDIVVQVMEVLPQYLELRGGFSTGEGIRAGMEYGYRNITLGPLSVTAALSVQLGYQVVILPGDPVYAKNLNDLPIGDRLRRRISLSFILPAMRPLGPYFRGSLDLATSRVIERQFAIDTASVAASLVYRPQRAYSLAFTPEFQVNNLLGLGEHSIADVITGATGADRERLIRLLLLPSGTTYVGAFRITGSIDLRDQVFNPHSGFYASATAEILGTYRAPGDPVTATQPGNTLHLTGSVAGYIPLHFLDIVLATNLRAGVNVHLENDPCRVTYTNRLFFMGGSESMRGWLQDTMIPQDVIESYLYTDPHGPRAGGRDVQATCTTTPGPLFPRPTTNNGPTAEDILVTTQRGGDVFINWRNELRIPLGTTGFALAAFLDVGNLWKSVGNVDLTLRAAAGGGIRYITPIGPVAFDLGANLAPQSFEAPFSFHFSIGVF
ncbi:MAG: BamA/TamA family outer membrane protein, partial [Deltaproteobacteria bacterium]